MSYYSNKAEIAKFIVYNMKNEAEREFEYNIEKYNGDTATILGAIEKSLSAITILNEEQIDVILEKLRETDANEINKEDFVICIFAGPAKDAYGFYIYQVLKKRGDKDDYYMGKPRYENYEKNLSSELFFNGLR